MPALGCFISLQRRPSVVGDQHHYNVDWCHTCEIKTVQVGEAGVFYTECQLPFRFPSLRNQAAQLRSFKTSPVFHRPSDSNDLTRPLVGNDCKWVGNGDCRGCKYLNSFLQDCPAWHQGSCSLGWVLCFFCFLKKAVLASLMPLASSFPLKIHFICPLKLGHFCLRCCFWWDFFFPYPS